jgi:hypothetical protein
MTCMERHRLKYILYTFLYNNFHSMDQITINDSVPIKLT